MRMLLLAVLLAACAPEQQQRMQETSAGPPAATDNPAASANGNSPPPPPPPPPPPAPSALPGLLPLTEAQVLSVLGSGASCALADGGALLMVAVPGTAVINDGGRILRLEAASKNWPALLKGGLFKADRVSLEVDAGAVVERTGEITIYDASTYLTRGRRTLGTSHGPRWSCGA